MSTQSERYQRGTARRSSDEMPQGTEASKGMELREEKTRVENGGWLDVDLKRSKLARKRDGRSWHARVQPHLRPPTTLSVLWRQLHPGMSLVRNLGVEAGLGFYKF